MTTKEKLAAFLGVDVKVFEPEKEATVKRVSDIEDAMNILLSGEVNDGE